VLIGAAFVCTTAMWMVWQHRRHTTDGWAAGQVTNKQMGVISDSGGGELSGPKHNLEIYDKGETWQTK